MRTASTASAFRNLRQQPMTLHRGSPPQVLLHRPVSLWQNASVGTAHIQPRWCQLKTVNEPAQFHHDEPYCMRSSAHLDTLARLPLCRRPRRHGLRGGEQEIIASLVFILASITDGLDGYLARRRHQITTMGMLLDPLADKLLVTAAYIILVHYNPASSSRGSLFSSSAASSWSPASAASPPPKASPSKPARSANSKPSSRSSPSSPPSSPTAGTTGTGAATSSASTSSPSPPSTG